MSLQEYIALQRKFDNLLAEHENLKLKWIDSDERNMALQRLIVRTCLEIPRVPFIDLVSLQLKSFNIYILQMCSQSY